MAELLIENILLTYWDSSAGLAESFVQSKAEHSVLEGGR